MLFSPPTTTNEPPDGIGASFTIEIYDAPSNNEFEYINSYLLGGGARYITNTSIKRLFGNDAF